MATTTAPQTGAYVSRRSTLLEWITTTDHKKIGVMYIVTSFAFFMLGGLLALGIRSELAVPGLQFIDEATYNQLFGMHAVMMIFLFVMPMTTGLANYIVPLQLGAADMSFPRINALSFWMLVAGAILILSAFAFGGAPTGWTLYAPLSTIVPELGVDLLLLGLVVLGFSSIFGAINFIVTIFKMRAPGMGLLRMPMFCWTTLVTAILLLFSLPVVAAGLIMLFIDRNYGGGFFDPAVGGSPILWQHIFWFFGHPEVYILILPAFGVISEIIPVFSRKPLFGYKAFVVATAAIGALGFTVWAHHMFTTGAVSLPFFAFFTFLIAVPTGVKFFNWLATMWGGHLRFDTPMLYAVGFIALFLIGGLDGAFLAVVPFDFMVQDTYWVVSHIHYVLVAGAVFAIFAALFYWFPKMAGRRLSRAPRQGPVLDPLRGHQPGLLPAAPAGPGRHDPAHPRLLRQRRLDAAQLPVHGGRLPHRPVRAALPVERLHHAAQAHGARGRPVGCQRPRVGHLQPATTMELRLAAGGPHGAALVRRQVPRCGTRADA